MRFETDVLTVSENVLQFIHETRSTEFEDRLFLRPEGGKRAVGLLRLGYLLLPWERHIFGWDIPDGLTVLPTYEPRAGAVQLTVSKYF